MCALLTIAAWVCCRLPLGLQAMRALAPPFHQLGGDCTVLCRCHCGSKLCGVMSAPILPVMDDVRGQATDARIAVIVRRLPRLVFERVADEQLVRVALIDSNE